VSFSIERNFAIFDIFRVPSKTSSSLKIPTNCTSFERYFQGLSGKVKFLRQNKSNQKIFNFENLQNEPKNLFLAQLSFIKNGKLNLFPLLPFFSMFLMDI